MKIITTYSNILDKLGKNRERIATLRDRAMNRLYEKFKTTDPMSIRVTQLFDTHAYGSLRSEAGLETLRELLEYAVEHGWNKLKSLRGVGNVTYKHIIDTLCDEGFIIVRWNGGIELSPEIAAMLT